MSTKASTQYDCSQYSKKMRLALSNEDIKNPDGSLNHKYFLVKKGSYWSELNQKNLIKGIGLFGNLSKFMRNIFNCFIPKRIRLQKQSPIFSLKLFYMKFY